MRPTEQTRVLVIGAGLMGASAARSLAERGLEVTILDRDEPASRHGSSHGSARIFRYGYPDPFYARLVDRARPLFEDVARRSGRTLITATGGLDAGAVRDPRQVSMALAAAGIEHELIGEDEARSRFPGIRVTGEVLWQPGAGVIDAEGTVLAQMELAAAAGARFLGGTAATEIRREGTGYRVLTDDDRTLLAEQVVIAAGGWLPGLLESTDLPAGIRADLPRAVVTEENAFHFPYREEDAVAEDRDAQGSALPLGTGCGAWPTMIYKGEDIQVYTLPGGRDAGGRGQKVAEYLAGKHLSDARAASGSIDPDNRERVVRFVREHLPGLVPEPYAETTCLFTMLPRDDFLVDRIEGITLLSPCSGHGAKFAPLIGELAADLVEGRGGEERFTVGAFAGRAA